MVRVKASACVITISLIEVAVEFVTQRGTTLTDENAKVRHPRKLNRSISSAIRGSLRDPLDFAAERDNNGYPSDKTFVVNRRKHDFAEK